METGKTSYSSGTDGKTRIIYSCSGIGSNVGQLANAAACRLAREGYGSGSCLAGLGGGVDKLVSAGVAADERIVIDGCPVACARKIMDDRKLTIDSYVVITDLGIAKTAGPSYNEEDVQIVAEAVRSSLQ